ncbi:putative membrane protein [Mycobacterium xenopi 4042]|nr:putative membrane protein [Mycobacterium xenopi 4042]
MLSIGIGLTNTLILLTGSLFVITAIHAIRSSERRPPSGCWLEH